MKNKFLTGLVMSALVSSMSYAVMAEAPAPDSSSYATKAELQDVNKKAADAYTLATENKIKLDKFNNSGSSVASENKANVDASNINEDAWANKLHLVAIADAITDTQTGVMGNSKRIDSLDNDVHGLYADSLELKKDVTSAYTLADTGVQIAAVNAKAIKDNQDAIAKKADKTALDETNAMVEMNKKDIKSASMLADTGIRITVVNAKAIKDNQDAIIAMKADKKALDDEDKALGERIDKNAARIAMKADKTALDDTNKRVEHLEDKAETYGYAIKGLKGNKVDKTDYETDKSDLNKKIDDEIKTRKFHEKALKKSIAENSKMVNVSKENADRAIKYAGQAADSQFKADQSKLAAVEASQKAEAAAKSVQDSSEKIQNNSDRIDMIEEGTYGLSEIAGDHEARVTNLEKLTDNKVDKSDFETEKKEVGERIDKTNKRVDVISDAIDANFTNIYNQFDRDEKRIAHNEDVIHENKESIMKKANVDATNIDEDAWANKLHLDEMANAITDTQTGVMGNSKRIDSLDNDVQGLYDDTKELKQGVASAYMLADTGVQIAAANAKAIKGNQDAIAKKADKTALDETNAMVAMNKKDIKSAYMLADTGVQIAAANAKAIKGNQDAIAKKADKTALDETNAMVAMKAEKADLDATNAMVATKADDAETKAALALKADKSALEELSTKAKATDDGLHATKAELGTFEMSTKAEFSSLREDVKNTGSLSAALGALQIMPYVSGERAQILVGVGNYKGATSAALGLTYNVSKNVNIHGGVAFGSGSDSMYSLGASFRIGGGNSEVVTPELATEQMNGMEARIETLEQQNAELRQQVQELLAKMSAK